MKSFAERNPIVIGLVGVALTAGVTLAALNYDKLPIVNTAKTYSAYFADAGGLYSGASVRVSGFAVGKVSSIALDGPRVLVKFTIDSDVHLGAQTEAEIKAKSLLGTKVIDIRPRGDGDLSGTIPLERTTSPYQLPDALGDLASTIGGLDTGNLSDALSTVAQTDGRAISPSSKCSGVAPSASSPARTRQVTRWSPRTDGTRGRNDAPA
jgi:phospholipid/cholesterol/gamma-HCH transport system substrate-binding protein